MEFEYFYLYLLLSIGAVDLGFFIYKGLKSFYMFVAFLLNSRKKI